MHAKLWLYFGSFWFTISFICEVVWFVCVIIAVTKNYEWCDESSGEEWHIIHGDDWFTIFIFLTFFAFQFCIGQLLSIISILKGRELDECCCGFCSLQLLQELDIQIFSKSAVNIIIFGAASYFIFNIIAIAGVIIAESKCPTKWMILAVCCINLVYSIVTFGLAIKLLKESIISPRDTTPINPINYSKNTKNTKLSFKKKVTEFCVKHISFLWALISFVLGIWWWIAVILIASNKNKCDSNEWITLDGHDWFEYIIFMAFFSFQFGIGQLISCITSDKSTHDTECSICTCECSFMVCVVPKWFICALHGFNVLFVVVNVLGIIAVAVKDYKCVYAYIILGTFVVNVLHSFGNVYLGCFYWSGCCCCCKRKKDKTHII
eukprot:292768_1